MTCTNVACALLLSIVVWVGTGAGWGYLILNLFLVLAVADAMVGALAAMFTMCSNNWRTAGQASLVCRKPAPLYRCTSWTCFYVYLTQPQLPAPAYNASLQCQYA